MKPLIAVAANFEHLEDRDKLTVNRFYTDFISLGGGVPFIVAPTVANETGMLDEDSIKRLVGLADGLVLPGGKDVHPAYYNQDPEQGVTHLDATFDRFQLTCLNAAAGRMPVLGICRGEQLLNVYCGGTLHQHLPAVEGTLSHSQTGEPRQYHHQITVTKDSFLADVLGYEKPVWVNSFHHQAVKSTGTGLTVTATAADGIIEAVEGEMNGHLLLGVQWHPEGMVETPAMRALAKAFVTRCATERK